MPKQKLTPKDISHLAKLSALQLTPEEIELYAKQFEETLTFVENMKELDTSSVSGAEHMSGQKNVYFKDGTKNERALTLNDATKNSKKHTDGYFIADRLI